MGNKKKELDLEQELAIMKVKYSELEKREEMTRGAFYRARKDLSDSKRLPFELPSVDSLSEFATLVILVAFAAIFCVVTFVSIRYLLSLPLEEVIHCQ